MCQGVQPCWGAAVWGLCSCLVAVQLFWGLCSCCGGGLAAPLPGSAAIQLCWHRNCQGSAAASRYTIPSEPRAEAAGEGRQLLAFAPDQLLSAVGTRRGWEAGESSAQPQGMVLVPSCLLDNRE